MDDDTQVDLLCQESDLDKSGNEEELSKVKGQQNVSKNIKRNLEDSGEETERPYKKCFVGERFFWSPPLVTKLLEFVKMFYPKLQSDRIKKSDAYREIYEKLKPHCDQPGLTLEIVRKKWQNILNYHRKLRETEQRTGRAKYYQFYDEVEELFRQFQKDKETAEPSSTEDNMPHGIVFDSNATHNGVSVPEVNSAQGQCSISNLTTQLVEDSSSDEESEKEQQEEERLRGKRSGKRRKRERLPNISRAVEMSMKELVSEHKQMVHCEVMKTKSIEKTCEAKDTLSKGIIDAINRRTDILERHQASSYRINDIYAMLQKYECKIENMDTRLLKLESTMYRIESLLEKIVNKLNEK
ncbi:hypothetical protein Anas_13375 [Armadillidium nasatum]|uniref:Myb/SANT-like DNA-binding domain-containing protein n=1 Tax=Armadillidium nasatum TaxID=96803 RepID=A0A5N5T5A6_9CRUS|nr:hypothetical protein Anas_13375 [Armadillidium nasatum]